MGWPGRFVAIPWVASAGEYMDIIPFLVQGLEEFVRPGGIAINVIGATTLGHIEQTPWNGRKRRIPVRRDLSLFQQMFENFERAQAVYEGNGGVHHAAHF